MKNQFAIPFEEKPLVIGLYGNKIEVFAFRTAEINNFKFGIKAPRHVSVNREEIQEMINKKK